MSSYPSAPGTPSSSASTPTSSTPTSTGGTGTGAAPSSTTTSSTTTATTSSSTPGPKRRKNASGGAAASGILSAATTAALPKPKKPKLHRNLDSITARNQLPNVPTAGAGRTGQRIVKGPYKKREKKEKPDAGAGGASGNKKGGAGAGAGAGSGSVGGAGGSGSKGSGVGSSSHSNAAGNASQAQVGHHHGGSDATGTSQHLTGPGLGKDGEHGAHEGHTKTDGGGEGGEGAEGENADGKEDDDDDHDEEPEYTEFEWNQEANSRGRSKEELKALLDCFSEDQLKRYEVYRRSVLSRPTIKKLVGTILNQQVTQTMAFVVAGFCKVYVGEMVEKAREVMEDWNETGPIRPEHLREAQRRYKLEEVQKGRGVQSTFGYKRRLFTR
ncbi:transcription initiation factor TFIID subunit 11 [Podila epigama]|nr:transcription initiation factor TFIID subunit 11 [Podila epigama]